MAMWGKIIGGAIGSMGGPIGIGIGAAIGHHFDRASNEESHEEQVGVAYMFIIVASMAKMAKADGLVTKDELARVNELFQELGLEGESLETARNIFRKEKDSDSDIGEYFAQFSKLTETDLNQAQLLYTILLDVAKADGKYHDAEIQILQLAETQLRLPVGYTDREVGIQQNSHKHAAELLGVEQSASETEIKQAYRAKCKEMHPDVLSSKGLPDELINYAEVQVQSYKEARDTLLAKS